jgi:hypothetical protein
MGVNGGLYDGLEGALDGLLGTVFQLIKGVAYAPATKLRELTTRIASDNIANLFFMFFTFLFDIALICLQIKAFLKLFSTNKLKNGSFLFINVHLCLFRFLR